MDKNQRKTGHAPTVEKFMDDEERNLYELIEGDAYVPPRRRMSAKMKAAHMAVAHATINESRVKISLRIPETDLQRLKAKALREGMPYQTLIGSILHKAVS